MWRQWIRTSLVQVMAYRLMGAKPLHKPKLTHSLTCSVEQILIDGRKYTYCLQNVGHSYSTCAVFVSYLSPKVWTRDNKSFRSIDPMMWGTVIASILLNNQPGRKIAWRKFGVILELQCKHTKRYTAYRLSTTYILYKPSHQCTQNRFSVTFLHRFHFCFSFFATRLSQRRSKNPDEYL